MATIVDFRVPIEEFALADTFAAVSDLHVEIERFVAQDAESLMPFVWVTADDLDAFEAAVAEDPTVESCSGLTEFNDERFYRMNWIDAVELVVRLLIDEDGAISQARTSGDSWQLQVMFPDRDSLSRTYEFCEDEGLSLTVDSIYELGDNPGSRFGLTETQYRTLVEAKTSGYYDVPRDASLNEVAERLDVSHQALSERLRRAHANLIDGTIGSTELDLDDRSSPDQFNLSSGSK